MAIKGIHYLLYSKVRNRLTEIDEEYEEVSKELEEAIAFGDKSENAEYDAAKDRMNRIVKERDELYSVIGLPQLKSSDSTNFFDEGSVISLKVFRVMPSPMNPGSQEFMEMIEKEQPVFEGIVLYGGVLSIHDLLSDYALSVDTPVGTAIFGKQSGNFSVKTADGFVNVVAKKLKESEFSEKDIGCIFRGAK